MTALHETTRRVEFRDTDAGGIMHFSAFFTYMEEAEHEYLRSRGLSVMMRDDEGPISWPRVSARCDYQSPVRFEDEVAIEVRPIRIGNKSMTYQFCFTHAGRAVATGEMTSVCCRLGADGRPRAIEIPDWIRQKLEPC